MHAHMRSERAIETAIESDAQSKRAGMQRRQKTIHDDWNTVPYVTMNGVFGIGQAEHLKTITNT